MARLVVGVNDLASQRPDVAAEWDYEKNGDVTPEMVGRGSQHKVYWLCPKGHSYSASIASRTGGGSGCPYCANKKVLSGFNDLATRHPELIAEWDYEKNAITPESVIPGTNKVVWWKCEHGHSYELAVSVRTGPRKIGCPFCSGKRVIVGENDLASQNPAVAAEWDYAKNGELTPETVMKFSNKKAWWICSNGHSWNASINNRSRLGRGCPYCSGYLPISGETDLLTINPDLAAQWSPRNGDLTPDIVSGSSSKNVWWIGPCGHEWQTTVANRHRGGKGCPYCAGQKVLEGFNDLATLAPDIAAEWNYERNGDLKPTMVTLKSSRSKIWWRCKNGHEWQAIIGNRTTHGQGCPVCSGHNVLVGYNDLATIAPDVAAEWDYERNGSLRPTDVTTGNDRVVWWICPMGHSYDADIRNRVRINRSCPICSNKEVLVGFNDLATTHPELSTEWCQELNGDLTPQSVTYGSNKMVWWECGKGHRWRALILNRSKGIGCPKCKNERDVSFPEKAVHYYMAKVFDEVLPNTSGPDDCLGRRTLDLYIPSIDTGVEYDGYYWHQDVERDVTKDSICEKNGVRVIRVREDGCPTYETPATFIRRKKPFDNKSLDAAISNLLFVLGKNADVDTDRDKDAIANLVSSHQNHKKSSRQMQLDFSGTRLAEIY